jgi:hypothetical protein
VSQLPNFEELAKAIPSVELKSWLDKLTPETRLNRTAASVALKAKGFGVSRATLASLASRGGGPRYQRFMGQVTYQWGDLLRWAESRAECRGGSAPSGRNQSRAEVSIAPAAAKPRRAAFDVD